MNDMQSGKRRQRIEVTRDDIVKGRRRRAHFCPVACALIRTLEVDWVSVTSSFFWMPHHLGVSFPRHVQWRIWLYDQFGWMWPFSFKVEVPE